MWRIVIVVVVVVRLRVIRGSCLRLLFRVVAFSFIIFREYSFSDFTVINFHY